MQATLFKKNAILIEQDQAQYRLYCDILSANGFEVWSAKSIIDSVNKIREKAYDLMVINTEIAEESFLEKVIAKIREEKHSQFMPIVGISLHKEKSKKNITKMLDAFLTKPLLIDKFIECVFNSVEIKSSGCKSTYNQ